MNDNPILTIRIETGNDAFFDSPCGETARILCNYAKSVEDFGPFNCILTDSNGNTVGEAKWTSEKKGLDDQTFRRFARQMKK